MWKSMRWPKKFGIRMSEFPRTHSRLGAWGLRRNGSTSQQNSALNTLALLERQCPLSGTRPGTGMFRKRRRARRLPEAEVLYLGRPHAFPGVSFFCAEKSRPTPQGDPSKRWSMLNTKRTSATSLRFRPRAETVLSFESLSVAPSCRNLRRLMRLRKKSS